MKPEIVAVFCLYAGFALLEILRSNFLRKPGQTRDDAIVETVTTVSLLVAIQPGILLASAFLMHAVFPDAAGGLARMNVVLAFGVFVVVDDMTQYWWHRLSHSVPWLYNMHRAHHNAEYMSVRLVYRNNLFYYALMPGIWFSGVLVYLGLGWVYAFYVVVKMLVIIGAHSDVCWDATLYRIRWLSPVMWLVERTISTPATHHAHHGRHKADGVTNYKGNFGNLLFFWDVLFGTAKITRRYPPQYGVENLPATSVGEQLAWPLFRAPAPEEYGLSKVPTRP